MDQILKATRRTAAFFLTRWTLLHAFHDLEDIFLNAEHLQRGIFILCIRFICYSFARLWRDPRDLLLFWISI